MMSHLVSHCLYNFDCYNSVEETIENSRQARARCVRIQTSQGKPKAQRLGSIVGEHHEGNDMKDRSIFLSWCQLLLFLLYFFLSFARGRHHLSHKKQLVLRIHSSLTCSWETNRTSRWSASWEPLAHEGRVEAQTLLESIDPCSLGPLHPIFFSGFLLFMLASPLFLSFFPFALFLTLSHPRTSGSSLTGCTAIKRLRRFHSLVHFCVHFFSPSTSSS